MGVSFRQACLTVGESAASVSVFRNQTGEQACVAASSLEFRFDSLDWSSVSWLGVKRVNRASGFRQVFGKQRPIAAETLG
jgi:hypothetical protein